MFGKLDKFERTTKSNNKRRDELPALNCGFPADALFVATFSAGLSTFSGAEGSVPDVEVAGGGSRRSGYNVNPLPGGAMFE